jgi:holo-[acyl-carrier protein] synthase
MIVGIGLDLVEISRFRNRKDLDDFLRQVLSEKEFVEVAMNSKKHVVAATMFAIKEAILKALGCGLHFGSYWHDIEITKEFVPHLRGFIKRLAAEQSISRIHVSHSCSKLFSVAVVILEG